MMIHITWVDMPASHEEHKLARVRACLFVWLCVCVGLSVWVVVCEKYRCFSVEVEGVVAGICECARSFCFCRAYSETEEGEKSGGIERTKKSNSPPFFDQNLHFR